MVTVILILILHFLEILVYTLGTFDIYTSVLSSVFSLP